MRRRLFSVFWRLVGSGVALVVLGGLCSMPLVVPGVIFTLHRIFYSEVLLVEGDSVRSSFRRSFALTDGGVGRLGLLVLAATLLLASLSWGFSLWAAKSVPGAALSWIGSACLALVKAALYLFAYYDLRARREGSTCLRATSSWTLAPVPRRAQLGLRAIPARCCARSSRTPSSTPTGRSTSPDGSGRPGAQHWLRDLPDFERWALLLACVAILAWLAWTMLASYREMMAPDASALRSAGDDPAPVPTWQALVARARVLASEGRVREGARALQPAVYSVLASTAAWPAWDGSRA